MNDLPAGDADTTVDQLKAVVAEFVEARRWQRFHDPKNLAMSLAIEAAELMEHFQWLSGEASERIDAGRQQAVAEEMADCLAYLLAIASRLDIDLSKALRDKMRLNAIKYPVERADEFRP